MPFSLLPESSKGFIKKYEQKTGTLVVNYDCMFEECFLFPVIYKDEISEQIQESLEKLGCLVKEIEKQVTNSNNELNQLVGNILNLVRFLFKYEDCKHEREARLMVYRDSKYAENDVKRTKKYVQCPLKLEKAILGSEVANSEELIKCLEKNSNKHSIEEVYTKGKWHRLSKETNN